VASHRTVSGPPIKYEEPKEEGDVRLSVEEGTKGFIKNGCE